MKPEERDNRKRNILCRGAVHWLIVEMDCRGQPGVRAAHCLVCENTAVVRRVWQYPENWYSLSDDELIQVCDLAG